MRKEDLDILLEKYFSGTSTEEEESTLRSFFASEDAPAGYDTEKEIFRFVSETAVIPEPSHDLNDRIISAVSNARNISIIKSIRRSYLTLSGIAAGILIILASVFFLTRSNEPPDTFKDPEIAYAATMKILYDVSSKLNEGTQSLDPVTRMNTGTLRKIGEFDRSLEIAGRSLRNLDHLRKVIEITDNPEEQ